MNDQMTDQTTSPSSSSSTSTSTSAPVDLGVDPYLVRYGSSFLLIVGTFGNILSFIVFSQNALRKSSTFRYLALLSLMDLLVLYSGLLDLFLTIEYGGAFSLRTINPITCRLHTFITYWSQHSSSWILSFISVDRAIATNCIQFARKFCTPRSAEYIVGLILIVIALLNCHELLFLHLQYTDRVDAPITTNFDDLTTLSPFRTRENFLLSNSNGMNNGNYRNSKQLNGEHDDDDQQQQKRNLESAFLLLSICDNPQWNFLCPREKRDLSSSGQTNRLLYSSLAPSMSNRSNELLSSELPSSLTSTTQILRQCAALKGSLYDLYWNNVWEWIDVCCYALIPFTVMSIGTFLIVYRVYYQERRFFRSRRNGPTNSSGGSQTPNKAKSLFYLLFTLNLLYFILVSPVVFATSILFRDEQAEMSYPRFKAIIYLMQYCNHSLNFIFYGITSPPYRQTLYGWIESLILRLPQSCQRTIRRRSKTFSQTSSKRLPTSPITNNNNNKPKQIRLNLENNQVKSTAETNVLINVNNETDCQRPKETIALLSS